MGRRIIVIVIIHQYLQHVWLIDVFDFGGLQDRIVVLMKKIEGLWPNILWFG